MDFYLESLEDLYALCRKRQWSFPIVMGTIIRDFIEGLDQ